MIRTAVIMAGGGGTRFWPISRMEQPKQLVSLTGDDVMINETIKHFDHIIPRENTFIVTNSKQAELMRKVLFEEVKGENILVEPAQRNTAPCIIYAAMTLKKLYGDALMAVLPADHHIGNVKEYERILTLALDVAEKEDKIVTIGIKPTFPSTGYGYIKYGNTDIPEIHPLLRFVEKPNLEVATAYLEEGDYLWNSGMFIWKASTILRYFEKLLPDMYKAMENIWDSLRTPLEKDAIAKIYPELEKVSIDYGIMEKADDVLVIPGDFGWNDVGSWDALYNVYERDIRGNVSVGDVIDIDSSDSVFFNSTKDRLVAGIGLKDTVVVSTKDAILVLNKDRAQDVKAMVDLLKEEGKDYLL